MPKALPTMPVPSAVPEVMVDRVWLVCDSLANCDGDYDGLV